MSSGLRPPRRPADIIAAAMSRTLKLGPARNKITIERGLPVQMRDGTILLADHYAPVTGARRATVLLRTPYGRGPQFGMLCWAYAEHGYHVLIESIRGTFGSGGQFTPGSHEAADGQDTVAWLRQQTWFGGKLVTVGPSYLAFAQWALALDPPPELTAMALYISPHDLAAAGFGRGPFELYNLLFWSDLMASQQRYGPAAMTWRTLTARHRLAAALDRLPIAATGGHLIGTGAPWYADWLAHPSRTDEYWSGYTAAAALDRVAVPTLLISGFHDFFAEQTMAQYQTLRSRGVPVALTVGPWSHLTFDLGMATRQTLAWFDAYSDGSSAVSPPRRSAVQIWTSGLGRWRDLPDWPPADVTHCRYFLRPGGLLDRECPADGMPTRLRYDPADPTPSVGGRLMSVRGGGSRDNSAVEARADVLTFTSAPLRSAAEIGGVPVVRLYVSSDNAYHDLFARLCDVGPDGRSWNLTDQIVRSVPDDVTPGEVRQIEIRLTDISHVFLPGHRIRLQLCGGAHPRYARNLGTSADLLHGTELAPVSHLVQHSAQWPSALTLPLVGVGSTPATAASRPAATALPSAHVDRA